MGGANERTFCQWCFSFKKLPHLCCFRWDSWFFGLRPILDIPYFILLITGRNYAFNFPLFFIFQIFELSKEATMDCDTGVWKKHTLSDQILYNCTAFRSNIADVRKRHKSPCVPNERKFSLKYSPTLVLGRIEYICIFGRSIQGVCILVPLIRLM